MEEQEFLKIFSDTRVFGKTDIENGVLTNTILDSKEAVEDMISRLKIATKGTDVWYLENFRRDVSWRTKKVGFSYNDLRNGKGGEFRFMAWYPSHAQIDFADSRLLISIRFYYEFTTLLYKDWLRHVEETELPALTVGPFKFYHYQQKPELSIPLSIVALWMFGEIDDEADPDTTLIESNPHDLIYESGSYPAALASFFRLHGPQSLDKLKEFGFLSEHTRLILKKRLGLSQTTMISKNSQGFPDMQALEQRVAFRFEDLEKLARIGSIKEPHSIGEWTELLGFASKGGTGPFIHRMEQAGMLKAEKLPQGTRLTRTDKAQTVLAAQFF